MRRTVAATTAGLLVLTSACGGSDAEAFCDSSDGFEDALQHLQRLTVPESDDVDDLREDLATFRDSAPDDLQDDAELVVDYLETLLDAVEDAGGDSAEVADDFREATEDVDLTAVGEAAERLSTHVLRTCE